MNRTEAIQWMLDDPENRRIRMIRDYTGNVIKEPKTFETREYSISDIREGLLMKLTYKNDQSWFEKAPKTKQMSFAEAFYLFQGCSIRAQNIKSLWDESITFANYWREIPEEAYIALWEVTFDNV